MLGPPTDTLWQKNYLRHRYMELLSEEDLRQRFRDIFRNFMTINEAGIGIPLPARHPGHGFWRLRFNHIIAEYSLRFGPFPEGMAAHSRADMYFPNPVSKRLVAGRAAVHGRTFSKGKHLFKFGKRMHVHAMQRTGQLRIAPASSFADAAFNKAIRDNELEIERWLHSPSAEELRSLSHLPGWIDGEEGPVVVTKSTDDFWIFCMSANYDAAMYDDFDCDACLVIHDVERFREQLLSNVAAKLEASQHALNHVVYVDPITQFEDEVPVSFQKHARHAYQDEVRAVWIPDGSRMNLAPSILEVGSLEAISEVIFLDDPTKDSTN